MLATSNYSNSSSNYSYCHEYIKKETPVEINLKLLAYTIAFIVAIIGNGLVIAIVLRKRQFKTTANMFIINMAFSDILMALVCMPTTMLIITAQDKQGQIIDKGLLADVLCKMFPFLQGLSVAVSVLTFLTLAVDRYLAIVYPFTRYITRNRAKLFIVLIWIISGLVNAPLLYAMRNNEHNQCIEVWEPHFDGSKASQHYTIVLFVFLYVLPLLLITFLYTSLIKELWRSVQSTKTVAYSENKAVLKMLVTVIVIFAVCWLPIHVIIFIRLYPQKGTMVERCGVRPVLLFIGWFMAHVNSSINPVIYFSFNEKFQHELIKWIRYIKNSCSGNKNKRQRSRSRSRSSRSTATSFVKPSIIVTQFTTNQPIESSDIPPGFNPEAYFVANHPIENDVALNGLCNDAYDAENQPIENDVTFHGLCNDPYENSTITLKI